MLAFWGRTLNTQNEEKGGGEKEVNRKRSTERRHLVEKERENNRRKKGRREGGNEGATEGPCVRACGLMRVQIVNQTEMEIKESGTPKEKQGNQP